MRAGKAAYRRLSKKRTCIRRGSPETALAAVAALE
jgi:hypothetical protein